MTVSTLNDDDIALAAELVLGLLEPAQAAQARARAATDRAFADEVAAWEERLQPMLAGVDETPPAHVWSAVESGIAPATGQDNPSRGVRLWRGLTALSTGVAAVLAVMLMSRPGGGPAPVAGPPLVAALGSETGAASLAASYDPASGKLLLTPVRLDTGALYPELWVIPADGKARSLGIIRGDAPTRVEVTPALRSYLEKGATLAVTPEPAGGAPGGKATGPVIASGTITAV
jgi:anti-sigma-K factor RskA